MPNSMTIMASGKSTLLIALLMIGGLAQSARAATFTVGGTVGWALGVPATFYDDWAKPLTFHSGDILDFAYPGSFHNVWEVSEADLATCNLAAPLKEYNTLGGASVTLSVGTHYFICGIPGHCLANMKMTVVVAAAALPPLTPKKKPLPPAAGVTPLSTVTETMAPAPAVGTSGASSHRSGPAIIVGLVLSCVLASLLFQ